MIVSAATLIVLGSAVCHATWNALTHRLDDQLLAFCWLGVAYLLVGPPLVLLLPAPAAPARPFLAVSVGLHGVYNLLLMRTYRLGEFNQVYPLARGTSPLLVALAAALVVGERLTPAHALGVVVICVGLASLVLVGGLPGRAHLPAVRAALGTGVVIATYSVVDGVGVRASGSPFGYAAWLFLFQGPLVPALVLARHGGRSWSALRPHRATGLAAGVLSITAYGLVLWAQTRGALATVAALRECSVIVGAGIGAVWFGERFGRARVVATVLVVAGIGLLNLR
ncbi:MAG TPA: DMT family transporter [Mycobacteriales bacterium]|nr:DMT family transporter [Mycobacteriales bacterium]